MLFIGIDLGTTNSAIAWGGMDPRVNRFRPHIIKIDRQVDEYEFGRARLLPSCAYFPPGGSPTIGDYAKGKIQEEPGRVAKSMKRFMCQGNHRFIGTGGVSWTPIEVSARILGHLKDEAALIFKDIFKDIGGDVFKGIGGDVVITVPASFEPIMRDATVLAANNAGFTIDDKNLLSEPHAALHYFCNKRLPDSIDFSTPKRVLVFDLGGGTLDVSLHEVHESERLDIKDLAVSPYTLFGGDDFDKRAAEEFLTYYNYPLSLSESEKELLKFQFQAYAEDAKIRLNSQIIGSRHTNPVCEIRKQPTLPERSGLPKLPEFAYNLYWWKYKEIIKPFLADHLDLKSIPCASDNIISPILNVLDKGKEALNCTKRPKVDLVLLNGGMTRLIAIQQRLENLFGTKIVRYERNPDEAVALGAVISQAP